MYFVTFDVFIRADDPISAAKKAVERFTDLITKPELGGAAVNVADLGDDESDPTLLRSHVVYTDTWETMVREPNGMGYKRAS